MCQALRLSSVAVAASEKAQALPNSLRLGRRDASKHLGRDPHLVSPVKSKRST